MLFALPVALAPFLGPIGCAAQASPVTPATPARAASRPRLDRNVLTRELMLKHRFTTVYDAVSALRSQWLRPRGPESFLLPLEVWVYLDDSRFGSVERLREIQPSLVASVRFYDGPTATSRWGIGHGAGVIHVSTWNTGALGFPGTVTVPPDTATRDSTARPDSSATSRDSTERRGRRPKRPDGAPPGFR